jgi:tetratricopeptide (TPR) repeat protein
MALQMYCRLSIIACALFAAASTAQSQINPMDTRGKGNRAATDRFVAQRKQTAKYNSDAANALSKKEYAAAEVACREALAIDKQDAFAWIYFAYASEGQGKYNQALKAYRALVYSHGWGSSINSDPTTLMRYVLALSRSGGRWDEAVAVFDRAQKQADGGRGMKLVDAQFDSARPDWNGMKAVAHYVLGTRSPRHEPADPAEQLKHLEAAVRLKPSWAAAETAYGRALEKAGRREDAKAAFQRGARK